MNSSRSWLFGRVAEGKDYRECPPPPFAGDEQRHGQLAILREGTGAGRVNGMISDKRRKSLSRGRPVNRGFCRNLPAVRVRWSVMAGLRDLRCRFEFNAVFRDGSCSHF